MKVFKFRLNDAVDETIMPVGARVLRVDRQGVDLTMWALVDPHAEKEARCFKVVGTGWDVPEGAEYIDTHFDRGAQPGFPNGFVWHIFEVKK